MKSIKLTPADKRVISNFANGYADASKRLSTDGRFLNINFHEPADLGGYGGAVLADRLPSGTIVERGLTTKPAMTVYRYLDKAGLS